MKSTSILVCAAALATLAFACGSEEHYVRRSTTIQESVPAPTPAPRAVIRTEEHTTTYP